MIAAYPKQMCTAVVPVTPVERALQRCDTELPGLLRPGLHVRLVDLDDVGARGEQVDDLVVDGAGVGQRQLGRVCVEVVLGLLRHRERPGHGDLDRPARCWRAETRCRAPAPGAYARSARPRAAPDWARRCGRARCRDCRCRRRPARWQTGWSSSPGELSPSVMMSSPARSWSRIAIRVASSWACSRYCGSTRHSSVARTRGGNRWRSRSRSISQSGWA